MSFRLKLAYLLGVIIENGVIVWVGQADECLCCLIGGVLCVVLLNCVCCCFQFLLLGAVPFPKDVPHLKMLGVGGVITLNEPYETLVPSSLYHVSDIPFSSLSIVFAF